MFIRNWSFQRMNEWMNVYLYTAHITHSVPRQFTILLEWDRTSAWKRQRASKKTYSLYHKKTQNLKNFLVSSWWYRHLKVELNTSGVSRVFYFCPYASNRNPGGKNDLFINSGADKDSIDHVRYVNSRTWIPRNSDQSHRLLSFLCLTIPKRDRDT